jgi:hypothetical protein
MSTPSVSEPAPVSPIAPTVSERTRELLKALRKSDRKLANEPSTENVNANYHDYEAVVSYIATLELDARRLDAVEKLILEKRLGFNGFGFYTFPIHDTAHFTETHNLRAAIDSAMESPTGEAEMSEFSEAVDKALAEERPASSRHPFEDSIPERYEVNAFDAAVRALENCECESMPCEHVLDYNRARVNLLGKFCSLHGIGA